MSYETTVARKTHVRLDPPDAVVLEPIIAQERTAFDMVRGVGASQTNAWLKPEAGWQLESLQRRASTVSELTALSSAIFGPSDLTTPAGFVQAPAFRQESDLPGVTYAGDVQSTGDLFYQKQVAAGDSWDAAAYRLAADQAAYPSPTAGAEDAPMDRVAVGTAALGDRSDLFLRFVVPGGKLRAPDHVLTFFFAGPPMFGLGQWAIAFGGDGFADVYEKALDGTWAEIERLVYSPAHQVGRVPHLVHIAPQTVLNNPKLSGMILFEFTLAKSPASATNAYGRFVPPGAEAKQAVISITKNLLSVSPTPVRIDIRRDLRVAFQVSRAAYRNSGSLTDDVFSASFFPTSAQPLLLAWDADAPGGCSVTGHLLDAGTGLELASAGSLGGFPLYAPAYPNRAYVAKFDFVGTGSDTPTLMSYRVQRDAVLGTQRTTETDLSPVATSLAITGADEDPSHESAVVHLSSSSGIADAGEHVVQIETEYDLADPTKRAVLFRGSIVLPECQFVTSARLHFRLSAVGMWQRLAESLSPIRFNFGLDYQAGLPFKVTDALRTLFALAGFGDESVDIPDLPIRLFASGDADGLLLEPQVSLGDLIVRYARDYLGYLVIADASVGRWRLVPLGAGSEILASFVSGASGAGGPPHVLGGYPAATGFIRRRSHRTWIKPPVGNVVIAFGSASAAAGKGIPQLYKQVVVNPVSFDFGGAATADPTSIDYLGRMRPIYQYLPAQAGADAVAWVARRVYDASCHGRRLHSFQAPLMLVADPGDPLLVGCRPLRVNDAVTVDGVPCRLRNVNPAFAKDAHQYAFYEAEEL